MSKDPSDPVVDLLAVQLFREGMIGKTWPRIHPHGHLSLAEWLDMEDEKGPQEVCAHQPTS
jgi:hypothetical protein